jgi:hypothetical protein
MVDFTPRYTTSGKEPEYIVNKSLGGTQRCFGRFGKEKRFLLSREFEP